ncbi:MAG: type II toxin-antitoxin system HicB family antitoxin [Chloroflexota bacterium]
MKFRVILEPNESGGYTVTVPVLPGCISEGDTREEALANIKEAIELYIESLEADGEPIPNEEVWLSKNPSAIASVRRGLSDAAKGKVSKVDINTL